MTTAYILQGSDPQTGLTFPSNGDAPTSTLVAFQFIDPQLDGLPPWGPSAAGVTYIWKVKLVQQAGYYTTFFWGNNGAFDAGKAYYGCHPYPQTPPSDTEHSWEISTEGGDWQETDATGELTVLYGQWFTQALRLTDNGSTSTMKFYCDLPSVATSNIVTHTTTGHDANDTSPALTFGEAPWVPGGERLSGVLRGIKIFDKVLSEADMLSEAASDALVTADGLAHIWYKQINPDPDDMLCEAGTGRTPTWANANHAALWTP